MQNKSNKIIIILIAILIILTAIVIIISYNKNSVIQNPNSSEINEIIKDEEYGLKAYYKIAIIYVTKNEFDKAMSILEYLINSDNNYINIIENEFVFNAMRSRIDEFLKNRNDKITEEELEEKEEIEQRKKSRKNWFSKENKQDDKKESILYDDIDMTRTGFRADSNKKE